MPAASSTLESKESSSPSAPGHSLPKSSGIEGGGSALYAGGPQTEIGITSNGGSTALPEESLAFAAEAERGCELGALGTSVGDVNACPCTWTWAEGDEEDVPNLGALPLAPALGHGQRVMKKTSLTSGLYPRPDGSSQGSPETFASHFEASWTTSPPEIEALP